MTSITLLCHAAGWCEQSKRAVANFEKTRSSDHYAIRWDGNAYPYMDGTTLDPSLQKLARLILAENEQIFERLYKDSAVYDVPTEFTVQTYDKDLPLTIHQGYTDGEFFWPTLMPLINRSNQVLLVSGKFTLYYMETCGQLSEYMPLWDKAAMICNDLRGNVYQFDKKVYSKNTLSKDIGKELEQSVLDLPLIIFTPNNKEIVI